MTSPSSTTPPAPSISRHFCTAGPQLNQRIRPAASHPSVLLRSLPPRRHRLPLRCSTVPQPSPADDFALIDDTSSPIYLQTLLHGGAPAQPENTPCSKPSVRPPPPIIEDDDVAAFVDDQTPPDIFLSPTVELASARSARRSTHDVRPASLFPNSSKRSRFARASQDPPDLTNGDGTRLRAPNGIPGGPPDLIQELLPLLAKEEQEERREQSEEETDLRQRVDACWEQFASMHRSTSRLDNLRPFRLREEAEEDCEACEGTGMTTCEYCKGEGFVDLGENAERFRRKFGKNVLSKPKRVTGNIYHCPLCGGLQEERCVKCGGSGVSPERKERQVGEADDPIGESAWQPFDVEELLEREADRIEVGLDGTIILRARKPKRTGRRGRKVEAATQDVTLVEKEQEMKVKTPQVKSPPVKKKRGRPRKKSKPLVDVSDQDGAVATDLSESDTTPKRVLVTRARSVGKSTDFVNTTDYKVGRKLRRQPTSAQQREWFSGELDAASAAERKQTDEDV